ncbi:MAG TPA: YfiR family protein [Candidatus Saccharimonadales bacterium]|nr:YfiR family protein [Candidatus Saccharimonadales bacterium]
MAPMLQRNGKIFAVLIVLAVFGVTAVLIRRGDPNTPKPAATGDAPSTSVQNKNQAAPNQTTSTTSAPETILTLDTPPRPQPIPAPGNATTPKPAQKNPTPSLLPPVGIAAPNTTLRAGPLADEVRIAVLYNMSKYVTWPSNSFASSSAPFVMGIFGDKAFAEKAQQLMSSMKTQNRTIQVLPLGSLKSALPAEWQICHLLFVPAAENEGAITLLSATKSMPILTVGENERFLESGGILALPMIDNMVKMELNETAAKDSGLDLGGKLTRLALRWTGK